MLLHLSFLPHLGKKEPLIKKVPQQIYKFIKIGFEITWSETQVAEQKLANAKTMVVIFWPWSKSESNIFQAMLDESKLI